MISDWLKVTSNYTGNNSFDLGVKLGKPQGKGISIFYRYYSGDNLHGEYVDFKSTYSAIGINLDL